MFDFSLTKLMVLALIAVVIFGPDQLPRVAAQAGRALRDLRRMAEGARRDLAEGLGPEFSEFDITDLNPRSFVRKHLLDDIAADHAEAGQVVSAADDQAASSAPYEPAALSPGERPPFDAEAT